MHVNNQVVSALMQLRGIDLRTLSSLAHATVGALSSWVNNGVDEAITFEQQLEVLNFLGVRGEAPRGDVVHYWHVHENFFSRTSRNYWALQTVLKAFGPAQVVYISREADPALEFSAKAFFGLKFEGFLAILAVTAHPLRNITFNPERMEELSWAPDAIGVLLPHAEYDRLEPGAMQVKGMTQYLTYSSERTQWDRLREQAQAQGLRAEQVANLLLGGAAAANVRIEAQPTSPPAPAPAAVEQLEPIRPAAQAAPTAVVVDNLFDTPVRPAARRA